MGLFIQEELDAKTIHILTSTSDPNMIHEESVSEAVKELVKAIKSLELYPSHQAFFDRFALVWEKYPLIIHRTFYSWQISQAGFQILSLNLSKDDFLESNLLKCRASFISVQLDDMSDLVQDKTIFDKCIDALRGEIYSGEMMDFYQLIAASWAEVQSTIERAPNYILLKSILDDAYQHWLASFEYSFAIQEEAFRLGQKWENHLEVISHSTFIYLAGLIDLLFVPNLTSLQVSYASKVFLCTQKMLQLSNWATTWDREFAQRDFTSGIYTIAIENGWIEWKDLKNGSLEKVKQSILGSQVEKHLWNEWERLRIEAHRIAKESKLAAFEGYINGFSAIMLMQHRIIEFSQ